MRNKRKLKLVVTLLTITDYRTMLPPSQSMVVPVDREGRVGDNTLLTRELSTSQEVSSRKAGGRGQEVGPQSVSGRGAYSINN